MAHTQIMIKTTRGDTIYGNAWTVDSKKAVANVVIAHGMAEYSFRYDKLAQYLNEQGFNVFAVDQPGHGLNVTAPTNPQYGLGVWPNNGFKLAISYLYELIVHVRLNMLPTILLGHSMGSFVSQRYLQRYSDTIDGLILSGSSAKNMTFVMGRMASKIMNKFMKDKKKRAPSNFFKNSQLRKFNRKFGAFPDGYKSKNRWISANEENVQQFDKDPLCGFTCSFSFYYNLFNGLKPTFQLSRVKAITNNVPILLIAGDKDPVGSFGKGVKKLKDFYTKGGQNVQMKLYPGMRHEIINEVDAEKLVFPDIKNHVMLCVEANKEKHQKEKHNLKDDIL